MCSQSVIPTTSRLGSLSTLIPFPETKLFLSWGSESGRSLIRNLLQKLSGYMDPNMLAQVEEAFRFGAKAHQNQTRITGEAYISHPVAVAEILGEMRMDIRTIIAAILHDVVEDTDVTLPEVEARFGADVAHLVDGVSKVNQLEVRSKEHAEAASFQKMFMSTAQDIRVIIIKLCDRLHNMHTLGALDETKRRRIANQTLDIYAPVANRMGMRELADALEDLSLKNLFPKRYNVIVKMVRSSRGGRNNNIKNTCQKVREGLQWSGMDDVEVEGREKSIYSIYCKARNQETGRIDLNGIRDIFALRVITANRNQCYQALGIIHNMFKPQPTTFKDYIAVPKANGYQSLHTHVVGPSGQPLEIQIRSRAMHHMAEAGVASHWRYKIDPSDDTAPQKLAQQWLNSFLESQQNFRDPGEFIEHLKADLNPDKVYVFTPKGGIMRLPRHATALDFAYAVHSDIGNRCAAAKINSREVPLHERLRNGNHVEIITSSRIRPEPGWLNYVVTSKARSSIRHYLHQQKSKASLKLGLKLLRKALWDQGYWRVRIPRQHKDMLLEALGLQDWEALLADIGFGNRLAPIVAKQLISEVMEPDPPPKPGRRRSDHNHGQLIIDGTEGLLVNYSKCCYPIPNDRIIGTTTADRGLVIHRLRCPNSRGIMKHPDQFFYLNWSADFEGKFEVMLKLDTQNEPGVLSEIANIIAFHDSNINKLNIGGQLSGASRMSFVIEVSNRTHLADIMRDLHAQKSVIRIQRYR